ncbi:hypothetical protein [Psychrobacter piscatorii]|uniref:hypothetical protein n=1 Tax=Psychrobacter piscatorii TaxID=554343 RepID=UPI0037370BF0
MSDRYSKDEIWAAAKLIWENTPQITDRELLDQLQTTYGNSAPKSSGSVSKRRRKEAWTKQSLVKSPKNSLKTQEEDAGSKQSRKQESQNSTLIPSKTNKAQNRESKEEVEAAGSRIGEIADNVVIDAKGRAAIIVKTRRRYANLGGLFDQALAITLSIPELADEAARIEQEALAGEYGANFEIGGKDKKEPIAEVEAAAQKLQQAMVLSKSLTETTTSLAMALKTISEVEMPLCGITADDFKQSDQDRRLGALAALGDINQKEREARERLQPELHERLNRIKAAEASADFGLDDEGNEGAADDIDEVDYTDVD